MNCIKRGLCNWNGLEQVVTTESNTLDDVYAYFFDPDREEEYIDVEKLINQFKAREISYEEFVALNTIHCKDDVRRLEGCYRSPFTIATTKLCGPQSGHTLEVSNRDVRCKDMEWQRDAIFRTPLGRYCPNGVFKSQRFKRKTYL